MSADTANTQSGERMRDGRTTAAMLRHRCRSVFIGETMSSNSTKIICACLLRAHRLIQKDLFQGRSGPLAALRRKRAVITIAELSAAPSALRTERLKGDTGRGAIITHDHLHPEI